MPKKTLWTVSIAVALCFYASHFYEERQAYKTGVYIGKSAFTAANLQNRRCIGFQADSLERRCELQDLNRDSIMEDALASANIIPSLSDSKALHTGFRDGWRDERTAIFSNESSK